MHMYVCAHRCKISITKVKNLKNLQHSNSHKILLNKSGLPRHRAGFWEMTHPLVPGADGRPEPSTGEAEMSRLRDAEDPMLWAERPVGSRAEGKAHLQGWGTPALGRHVIQLGGQSWRGGLRRSGNREEGLGERKGPRHPCIPTHRARSHLTAFPEAAH